MRERKKTFSIKSEGDSMFPLLQTGDIVQYQYCTFKEIKENDIVLTHVNEIFMTHRVIYKNGSLCITRGDNNQTADKPVKKDQIFARATRFGRNKKWYGIQDIYLHQSILYLHEISNLEAKLCSAFIPHVFLKGVLVSLRYENTIPKRIYADCDLLVRRSDAQKIESIFTSLGYRYVGKTSSFGIKKNKFSYPEISFAKNIGQVSVVFDLHFEPVFLMTQLSGMNLLYDNSLLQSLGEKIIKNGKKIKVKGVSFFLPSRTDQILYLILHIFHHNFVDSMRYSLLNSVIRKSVSQAMWRELKRTIQKYHLEGYSYLTLLLLKKHYKTPIPSSFLGSISPTWIKKQTSLFLLNKINIFNQDNRLKAGIERFVLIFILSPEPLIKKLFIFFHPDTLRSLFFVLGRKMFKSLK